MKTIGICVGKNNLSKDQERHESRPKLNRDRPGDSLTTSKRSLAFNESDILPTSSIDLEAHAHIGRASKLRTGASVKLGQISPMFIRNWQLSLLEKSFSAPKTHKTHVAAAVNCIELSEEHPNAVSGPTTTAMPFECLIRMLRRSRLIGILSCTDCDIHKCN